MPRPANTVDRILSRHVDRRDKGCWLWLGKLGRNGYGHTVINRKFWLSHRLLYTYFKGPIAEGLTIDHLCRNRSCCNPDHLEAVSCRENSLRAPSTVNAINSSKTQCIRGHLLSGDNLYITPDGRRQCRTCRADKQREWNLAKGA